MKKGLAFLLSLRQDERIMTDRERRQLVVETLIRLKEKKS